jgi:hypothetical protein
MFWGEDTQTLARCKVQIKLAEAVKHFAEVSTNQNQTRGHCSSISKKYANVR